jgi:hypothetical protein
LLAGGRRLLLERNRDIEAAAAVRDEPIELHEAAFGRCQWT